MTNCRVEDINSNYHNQEGVIIRKIGNDDGINNLAVYTLRFKDGSHSNFFWFEIKHI